MQERIRNAEAAAGRAPGSVELLAVSKTQGGDKIRQAWEAGQRMFGESYLQEAVEKVQQLRDLAIEWHFIGRIQSNKTASIARHFDWVHTLGSLKHARRLHEQRPQALPPLNICIQLNLSGESSKSGISADELAALAAQINDLSRLRLRGLMTMPPAASSEQEQRDLFSRLRLLKNDLQQQGLPLDTLSMGMSNDMQAAICEGATMVRIGTAIFGARS